MEACLEASMALDFEKPGSFARWARRYCCGVRAAQLHKKQENMAAVVENAVCTSARNHKGPSAPETQGEPKQ